jgi:hypothetical protein
VTARAVIAAEIAMMKMLQHLRIEHVRLSRAMTTESMMSGQFLDMQADALVKGGEAECASRPRAVDSWR